MQFTSIIAVLFALATLVVTQNLPPQCAFSCLQNTPTNGCNPTDASCLCRNAKFIADQSTCIKAACSNPSDLQQAEAFASAQCLSVGVTLSAPSSTAAAAETSASAATPVSETASPSSTPKNAASSLSVPVVLLAGIAACALAL